MFSKKELEILEKGMANAAYQYLGSAKVLGGIGAGFVESMAELQKKEKT